MQQRVNAGSLKVTEARRAVRAAALGDQRLVALPSSLAKIHLNLSSLRGHKTADAAWPERLNSLFHETVSHHRRDLGKSSRAHLFGCKPLTFSACVQKRDCHSCTQLSLDYERSSSQKWILVCLKWILYIYYYYYYYISSQDIGK